MAAEAARAARRAPTRSASARRRPACGTTGSSARAKRAVPPLEVRHLLGQRADDAPARLERLGVQRVAGGAQLRLPDVRRFGRTTPVAECISAARPSSTSNGPNTGAAVPRWLGRTTKPPDEALARAEAIGGNLMAERAGDAVGGQPCSLPAARPTADARTPAPRPPAARRRGARHRHVTDRALVLDRVGRRRVVDGLAAHRRLPVRIARRVRHHRGAPGRADRDVLAARVVRPLWQARQLSEVSN